MASAPPVETTDITLSWEAAATICAVSLRDGERPIDEVLTGAYEEIRRLGRLMDRTLEFVESQGLTDALKAFLEGYEKGRRLADGR